MKDSKIINGKEKFTVHVVLNGESIDDLNMDFTMFIKDDKNGYEEWDGGEKESEVTATLISKKAGIPLNISNRAGNITIHLSASNEKGLKLYQAVQKIMGRKIK